MNVVRVALSGPNHDHSTSVITILNRGTITLSNRSGAAVLLLRYEPHPVATLNPGFHPVTSGGVPHILHLTVFGGGHRLMPEIHRTLYVRDVKWSL